MAYKITDKCISCGACAAECPVGCISQGEDKFVIDASACISFPDKLHLHPDSSRTDNSAALLRLTHPL